MMFTDDLHIWFILLFIGQISGVPFNQPIFCPNASWNPNAITFANISIVGSQPWDIFITTNNTVYVTNGNNEQMIVWSENSSIPIRNISLNTTTLVNVFVTEQGDVYFGYTWNSICGLGKWSSNSSTDFSIIETCPRCYDVFIDGSNNIYCSMDYQHQVIRKSLNDESDPVTIVAGTGIAGSASNMLYSPNGLFVDTDFDLYVADCFNNRIQLFPLGQSNGITVAGNGSSVITISLFHPSGIVLDANNYLFILDFGNSRIVGSGPNGFRCLVGCSGNGSAANQLNNPRSISFDTFGNIFVVDTYNNRIQKFILMTNSCNETTASPVHNMTYPSTNASNIVAVNTSNSISYNQPKFDPYAVWSPNAITLADSSIFGTYPFGIFINKNNTIYVNGGNINQILIWTSASLNPTTIIYTNPINLGSIFVTSNGDIYTGSANSPYNINRWASYKNGSAIAAYSDGKCYGVFVDINNTLYFSLRDNHIVLKKPLSSTSNILTIVAGTGCLGNSSNMLNGPHEIFVDINFDLYVADGYNNRIQLFRSGQLNAITVVGSGSTNITITLNTPTGVVLDDDKYLFIAEYGNNRIVGSGPYGFRCIVGCTGSSSSTPNTLYNPTTMAFDRFGNLYVVDQSNRRIQKFVLLNNTLAPSYNQPKFCPNATWNPNATTFADVSIIGSQPNALFININNTIYGINNDKSQILIWLNESIYPSLTLYGNLSSPISIFVTVNNDIYVDNVFFNCQVEKFTSNTNNSVSVMSIPSTRHCYGLFVDISNTLYCSVDLAHKVFKKWLGDNMTTPAVVAGTGSAGSTSYMLNNPNGIFVDTNFDLYVADYDNNRIQLFQLGNSNGITVAGNSSLNITITLNNPTDVILDGNKYLFISDTGNNRIVGSDQNGFRCIVGCTGSSGSGANQLNWPRSISFDSFGNLYVADINNNRIQKFILLSKLCNDATTPIPITTNFHKEYTTSTISMNRSTCYSPKVTLIPSGSTLSNPLQFRRSQDFDIVSIIELICNDSLSMTTQWIIKNCTNYCSSQIKLDSTISVTSNELYIPSRTLAYGTYELQLLVTMTKYPSLSTFTSVYVRITPSGITANLVQLGTSMITSGHEQALQLNPGSYSIDPDQNSFNSSNWIYKYYCRIYGLYMFPNLNGLLLSIDDLRNDSSNPSCLSNRTGFKFGNSINSSLTILSNTLQSNRTYQFMVQMENIQNSSQQATGYVLVNVEDTRPQMIAIGCVIVTMCSPNLEFQVLNPTTQVALFALCIGNCSAIQNITWNVYSGQMNTSANYSRWTLFNQTNRFENLWFFGRNTSNFTSTNQLFLSNPQVTFWRFEVVYSFPSQTSTSALNFVLNQPPVNGSCSIFPLNGTTSTLFTITCPNWVDEDGIKDYSFYTGTTANSQEMMAAFSSVSILQVRLPAGDDQTGQLYLMASIRDQLNCIAVYNMSFVIVLPDLAAINDLISSLQSLSNQMINNNPIVQLLASGNQNTIGQIITSISQQFNTMNIQSISKATSSGIPAASISISSLDSQRLPTSTSPLNQSALIQFNNELNTQANVREYLISYTKNLIQTTSNSIILQSSSLAQLTQATNQLTRTTLNIAAERCYQLSMILYSISTRIAYEDAVNGPLQQRTSILNSDSTRATAFPDDYDTDLESEWSKLNLFGNPNLYYQKQLANQIQNQMNEILSKLISSLNIQLNIGQQTSMNTFQMIMSIDMQTIQSLTNEQIKQVENAQIHLPSILQTNISTNQKLSVQSMMQPLAPFGNSQTSANTNLSRSISLSIADQYGNQISIKANDSQPIEIIIPRDPNLIFPPMILQNVTSTNSTPHYQLFYLHYVNITTTLSISVHFELHPLNTSLAYLLIYKFDQIPQLNSSIYQIDGWTILCPSNLSNDSIYTYFLNNQLTQNHQSLVFGLRELNSTESNIYCSSSVVTSPPITNRRYYFTSNYQLRIYTSGCYYLDENNQWNDQGLRVGSLTNHNQTQCFSTHLTTFAGGFLVLPEPINWQYVFAHANFIQNKTVYLTVICLTIIYILFIIYARYKDKNDLKKLGIIPLSDNHQLDKYYYQILVFTGHRKYSGTKSRVQFILASDSQQTHVRTFENSQRDIFQRGGIDGFLMSTSQCLGPLNYLHIWHDNSGQGSSASWFLKYILIRDSQTMETSYFISQQWFAVEKDDGKIERVLSVANENEMKKFSYLFFKQSYHNISDNHLWFSIFARPPSNRFTCVQRCTCCFVLFFVSMFLNIMYYDLSVQNQTNNSTNDLTIGPLYISRQQIGIGIIVELFSLIPSLLLVQMFRRLRSREKLLIRNETIKTKRSFTFPWWFIYPIYGFCLILVGLSIFFILVRGIEFGDLKTQQWLTSILSSFLSSIFLIQPLKIICLSIFFACLCRKSNDDDDQQARDYLIELNENEEYLSSIIPNKSYSIHQLVSRSNRLTQNEIVFARQERLKEIQMWSFLHELSLYLILICLLFLLIIYSNQTVDSYLQVQHLQNHFDFNEISTIDEFWNWLDESFVNNLRAQQWYNDDPPRYLSGYINDKTNRLIGWAIMRQLRIKSSLCSYQKLNLTCYEDFHLSNEETNSFELGWINQTTMKSNSTFAQAFQYQSNDGYTFTGDHGTYPGGGYIYEFRGRLSDIQSNLSSLHQFNWIDSQTRAIIIQLSLYNPNVQLFTSAIFLTEFLSTGNLQIQSRFEPISSFDISNSQLICTIIYMILIIYLMFIEIRSFLKLKSNYFKQFWSFIEVGIIVCSWTSLALCISQYREYNRISQQFAQTNGYSYINLQYLTYLNNFLIYLYGYCWFFGLIKSVRLFRFNSHIYLFISTLKRCAKDVFGFLFMFSIVLFAFVFLFYLLFSAKLWSASSFLQTTEMLFEIILMKFNAHDLVNAHAILGPIAFCLFIFVGVFVCLSMFITIINHSFRQARENQKKDDDTEIYSFIWTRFVRWLRLKKANRKETYEEYDARMRTQYFDSFKLLEKRTDELLEVLNRAYIDQYT